MLGTRDRPQWQTVVGGSHRYVEALTRPLGDRLRLSTPIREIRRHDAHAMDGIGAPSTRTGTTRMSGRASAWGRCRPSGVTKVAHPQHVVAGRRFGGGKKPSLGGC